MDKHFSDFGTKLNTRSGILQLMDDLGKPLPQGIEPLPLGGGNPARIAAVEQAYRQQMEALLADGDAFEVAIARYDAPQGRMVFVQAVAKFLSDTYGWPVTAANVAITNGSQSAMFSLFNLFGGTRDGQLHTILFPLMPEYVGYADQGVEKGMCVGIPSICTNLSEHEFKYSIDFPAVTAYLDSHPEVAAMCVSRPTNPSGNVITDTELAHLVSLAHGHGIPLLLDNAYGLPFPDIVFTDDATPFWNEDVVLSMSLSKIGLPALRTGIVVAREEIVTALSNINAIAALTPGSMGQVLAGNLIASGEMVRLATQEVMPFYRQRAQQVRQWIDLEFTGTNYMYHRIEGAIFCWLYLPDLDMSTCEFYKILKDRGVVTVPGEYSFFGYPGQAEGSPYPHPHQSSCLRLNYSAPQDIVRRGIAIIAEEYRRHQRIHG